MSIATAAPDDPLRPPFGRAAEGFESGVEARAADVRIVAWNG